LYLGCATAARQQETFRLRERFSITQHYTIRIFFFVANNDPVLFFKTNLRERLLMVGPCSAESNVLRDTDGERFVRSSKAAIFMENLNPQTEDPCNAIKFE
jgi:hypothetical protein